MTFDVNRLLTSLTTFKRSATIPKPNVKPGLAISLGLASSLTPIAAARLVDRAALRHKFDTNLNCPSFMITGITDKGTKFKVLRDFLRENGFTANISSAGRNNGPTKSGAFRLKANFKNYFNKVNQPINLIGHHSAVS